MATNRATISKNLDAKAHQSADGKKSKPASLPDILHGIRLPSTIQLLLTTYEQLITEATQITSLLKQDKKAAGQPKNEPLNELLVKCKGIKAQLSNHSAVLVKMGNVICEQGKLDEALQCYQQAYLIDRQISGEDSIQIAKIAANMANVLFKRGKYQEALAAYAKALPSFIERYGTESHEVAIAYNNIGNAHGGLGQFKQAIAHTEKALAIWTKLFGPDSFQAAMALNNLANLFEKQDKHAEAIQLHERVLAIHEKYVGKNSPQTALTLDNMGRVYRNYGLYAQSLIYHRKALRIRIAVLGMNHIDVATTLSNIGVVLYKLGKYPQALKRFNQVLTLAPVPFSQKSADMAELLQNRANVFFDQGEYKQALGDYEQALAIKEIIFGKNSFQVAEVLINIANVYAKQDQHQLAQEKYDIVLKLLVDAFGKDSSQAAQVVYNLGNLALSQHQYQRALKYYSQVLIVYKRVFGEESIQAAEVLANIGAVHASQDQYPQALNCLQNVLLVYRRIFKQDTGRVSAILNNIGAIFLDQGNCDEALIHLEMALKIDREVWGEDNDHTASTLINIGNVYVTQHKYQQALGCYTKAIAIKKTVYGEKSSQVATVLGSMGHVFADHAQFGPALQCYQLGLTLLESCIGPQCNEVAMMLGNISVLYAAQDIHDQAFDYAKRALQIFIELLGENCDSVATAYNNIAGLLIRQHKFGAAVQHYQKAFAIRQKLMEPHHYATCEVRLRLARAHVALADSLEDKTSETHYREAATHYEELLQINEAILAKRFKEFTVYDLVGHNRLLTALTQVYVKQGHAAKAGMIYYEQAQRFQDVSPIITLYFCRLAIKYLLVVPGHKNQLVLLYQLNAQIAYRHQRYHFSIHNLEKALELDAKADSCERQLKQWREEQAVQLRSLDKDIYNQLEYCRESYDEIQLVMLEELESKKSLSGQTKNRITELVIKINNILDMAFGRFARTMVHEPNSCAVHHDLYYLPFSSPATFLRALKRKQLVVDVDEFEESLFGEFKKPQGMSIRQTLTSCGYLDAKSIVTNKLQQDPLLKDLPEELSPIQEEIAALLTQAGVGKPLTKAKLSELNNKLHDPAYYPPTKDKIVAALEEHEYITVDLSTKPNRLCKVTEKFKLQMVHSHLGLREGKPESKQFARYERQMIAKIQFAIAHRSRLVSLNKHYPHVYNLLEHEQPYHYHSEGANQNNTGLWRQSWLEIVVAISNGSKHIGLTPQGVADKLAEQTGTIRRDNLCIMVNYVEPAFYPWTFAAVLEGMSELTDLELLQVSNRLLQVLKHKGYIDRGVVAHPLAQQYRDAVKKAEGDERIRLEKTFCQQLQADLPKELQPYVLPVAVLMLRRVLQHSHIELHADCQVELHGLMGRALAGCQAIAIELGKATVRDEKKPVSDKKAILLSSIQTEHREIVNKARAYCASGEVEKAGDHYYISAKKMITVHFSLGLYYYRKAFYFYNLHPKRLAEFQQVCLEMSGHYAKAGLWHQAIHYIQLGRKRVGITKAKALQEKRAEYQQELRNTLTVIDTDIHSQLAHAKQQCLKLEYFCFKLVIAPTNPRLQYRVENLLAEIAIKLRHLLDQALTRLVHSQIYLPNNKWVTIHIKHAVKYYAFSSPDNMADELRKKEILQEEKTKVSLDRNFPEVYQQLVQAQSFSCADASQAWLSQLIAISNKAKHQGLVFSTSPDFLERLEETQQFFRKALAEVEKILTTIFKSMRAEAQKKVKPGNSEEKQDFTQFFRSILPELTGGITAAIADVRKSPATAGDRKAVDVVRRT